MSGVCSSYYNATNVYVNGFSCPRPENDAQSIFCCGFIDIKYCCDDPNSFFPYEYGYMWWLSVGALVGLSIAAVVLLAFVVTVCVLCYLFIATKPTHPDTGLSLRAPGYCAPVVASMPHVGPSAHGDPGFVLGDSPCQNPSSVSHISCQSVRLSEEESSLAPDRSGIASSSGPQGIRKLFQSCKLDCDSQAPDPERVFQRCFTATVPRVSEDEPP